MRLFVGMFLSLFCVVDLETSIGLVPAVGKLMMLSRLLIVPGIEHSILNISINLCFLVLKPRVSGAANLPAKSQLRSTLGAVEESHDELTRITLKHSTCSHK